MNVYDKNGKPVFFSNTITGSFKQDQLSLKDLKKRRKKADLVVVRTHCGIQVIEGIKATAILAKTSLGEYKNQLIWPIKKHKRSRVSDIIVFFNKKTLEGFYKIGEEARQIQMSGKLPEGMEMEFSYFNGAPKWRSFLFFKKSISKTLQKNIFGLKFLSNGLIMDKIIITKSFFKEFCENPKLAWWHKHDPEVYKKINKDMYGAMNGALIGQEVESMVKKLRESKDVSIVAGYDPKGDYHKEYSDATLKTISHKPPIIYQAGLVWDNLFVKCDFLKLNDEGKYDLIEVKAKNNIRKTNKNETLLDDLIADCSFQKYVLHKSLGDKFSGRVWIYSLNKEYIRDGDVVPSQIITKEDVTEDLATTDWIEKQIALINKTIGLSKSDFEQRFPYQGENPLIYFGEPPKKGTIRNIPHFKTSKKKLLALYELGKIHIDDLGPEELELISSKDIAENNFQKYIKMFKEGVQFDKDVIESTFESLSFPLFFYDYETVSWPIPIFQKTSPRQQTVVQYSMHKMDVDGTIMHYEGLISPLSQTNSSVVDKFVKDVGNPKGTFIVRNKGFENSRNDEMGNMYPEYKEFFEQVNLQTFDLMDIFRNLHYFDPNFGGSCSIKKVLPVVSNITYKGMTVSNGGVASDYLYQLIQNKLPIQISTQDLLEYCKQDTRAMVEIYKFLKQKIN